MQKNRRMRRKGFTLLEILIVVGIIALLAAFVVPNLMQTQVGAEKQLAQSAVDSNGPVATAIKLFRMHIGRYPTELKELTEKPDAEDEANKWNGPYLEDATKLKDPWGEEYQYKSPGDHHADTYDLWSKGPDRQDGNDDDIGNWAKEE